MELIVFIVLIAVSLIFLIFSGIFPSHKGIALTGCFSILILGVLLIGQGIEISGITALKNSLTQNIGVMLSVFGVSTGILAVI
jgi:hypothetical protein